MELTLARQVFLLNGRSVGELVAQICSINMFLAYIVLTSCNMKECLDRVHLSQNLHMPGIFSQSVFETFSVIAPPAKW